MGPVEAIRTCFAKSFVWRGRAPLAEFWWFALAMSLVGCVYNWLFATAIEATGSLKIGLIVYLLLGLVVFFPNLAVTIRRLHDIGRNGAWFWISFVPFIGAIILLVFMVTPSNPFENRYGPHPYGTSTPPPGPHPAGRPGRHEAPTPGAPDAATPGMPPAAVAERPPVTTPGLHWCATRGCPMYQTNVGRETCYSCGNPTQETEPR